MAWNARFKPVGSLFRTPTWDKRRGALPRGDEESPYGFTNSVIPDSQEKFRREPLCGPYRKPTQVGRVKILRRLREASLRNSA